MSRFTMLNTIQKLDRQFLIVLFLLLAREAWAQDRSDPLGMLTIWAGAVPIILSAPHGGREPISGIPVRKGQGVRHFTTERDSNTAELAEQVALTLASYLRARPFLVVARFERKYIDANRAPGDAYENHNAAPYYDAYHRAFRDASTQTRGGWRRGLLLDLHGQGAERETIFRGTAQGLSVTELERRFGREAITGAKSILGYLAAKGYKIAPGSMSGQEVRFTGGFIIRNYGSHDPDGIDAIQLELGAMLRERRNLKRTSDDLAEAIAVFAKEYLPLSHGATQPEPFNHNSAREQNPPEQGNRSVGESSP